MIKAIIFDCFGVLAGSGFADTYRHAGGDPIANREFINEILHAVSRGQISVSEMNKRVSERLGLTVSEWVENVENRAAPNLLLFEMIADLKKSYKIGLISNANVGVMESMFNAKQLSAFGAVIVSAEVGLLKPESEIYKLAAKRLGVELNQCIFTDDSLIHCKGAEAVGMKSILYMNLDQFKSDLQKLL